MHFLLLLMLPLFHSLGIGDTTVLNKPAMVKDSTELKEDSLGLRFVQVNSITIIGNDKTRERIILRELDFRKGDVFYINDLKDILKTDEDKIFNTRLFVTVDTRIVPSQGDLVNVIIIVKERWYTWPVPIFKLSDRNFNDWWTNQHRDLSRVEYGIRFDKYNLRGLNEKLSLLAQFGYTHKLGLLYRMPYINKAQTLGLEVQASYSENNNVAYKTLNNKQVFLDAKDIDGSGHILKDNFNAAFEFVMRNNFYNYHYLAMDYDVVHISDTLASLAPDFLGEQDHERKYFTLRYEYKRDLRDHKNYPLKGSFLGVKVEKIGLGIFNEVDILDSEINLSYFQPMGKSLYLSSQILAYNSFPKSQPYYFLQGLGYSNHVVRGYQLYLIQGQHYWLHKTSFKWQLFNTVVDAGRMMPIKQFRTIPFAAYLKLFYDQGFVENPINPEGNEHLSNSYLYGYGVGLDLVSYYDSVIRMEYTINRDGESGVFFSLKAGL